jgi:hypothetical protein
MPKTREKQKRVGPVERKLIAILVRKAGDYSIFRDMRKKKETAINHLLMHSLRQKPDPLMVSNKAIPVAKFVGEQFRPEFYLLKGTRAICAVECKRLTEKGAKGAWKAGLSQALLYSAVYKAVVLIFYDFTSDGRYHHAFQENNSPESRFAKKLARKDKVQVVVIKPVDS